MEFHPTGLATGIGSLPFLDKGQAVKLVREQLSEIPHWPQLPKSDYREFYLWQFLQLLQDLGLLKVTGTTSAYFTTDEPDWPERQAIFYDLYLRATAGDEAALARFAFPLGAAEGFYALIQDLGTNGTSGVQWLKGQVVGLLSVGFQITDPEKRPAYYDPMLRDLLLKQLSLQAAWQQHEYQKYGLPSLVFMDDPVIDSCGRYDRICVSRHEVMDELGEFAACVRSNGGLAGVHSCADLDWSLLLEADIDIISFDAYQFGNSFTLFPDLINKFLGRGGVVAWGIVPTAGEALAGENLESLQDRMSQILVALKNKGVKSELLRTQSLLTPACGAGTLPESEAELIYQLVSGLAGKWDEICSLSS